MIDADEITPWASWDDQRIISWARARGLNRYPVGKVELMTADNSGPNIAVIDFQAEQVTRERSPIPAIRQHSQKGER